MIVAAMTIYIGVSLFFVHDVTRRTALSAPRQVDDARRHNLFCGTIVPQFQRLAHLVECA
jgi:hypothetical protein